MAESKTSICNLALSRFGSGKISSLDDGTETSRLLDLNYDNCLESVLRAFPWNFARKIEALALSTDTTPGFDFVYQYPVNCAKALYVFDADDINKKERKEKPNIVFSGTAKTLATDIEDAYIEYTYYVVTPTLYDPLFVKALSYLLAAEICNAKSGNAAKSNEMLQKYGMAIAEAQHASAVESVNTVEWPSSYIKGRR